MNHFKDKFAAEQNEWLKAEFLELYKAIFNKSCQQQRRDRPQMMTVKELSEATGVSQYAIRKMYKSNEIPYVKSGVKVLINRDTFTSHLKGNI